MFKRKATAQDGYDNFKECSTSLDEEKIIQVSSDGPNIHLNVLNLMRENRKKNKGQCTTGPTATTFQ